MKIVDYKNFIKKTFEINELFVWMYFIELLDIHTCTTLLITMAVVIDSHYI